MNEIKHIVGRLMLDQIWVKEFEHATYNLSDFESLLGSEPYLELISLDYNAPNALERAKGIIRSVIPSRDLYAWMKPLINPNNKITFENNPWPEGHLISNFIWFGHIDEKEQFYFDFTLQSVNYDAEDQYANDEEEDAFFEAEDNSGLGPWQTKFCWLNYDACNIYPSFAQEKSGLALQGIERFDLNDISGKTFYLDSEVTQYEDDENLSFKIYCQGHDAIANHIFRFNYSTQYGWIIDWQAKIASIYLGDETFRHTVKIHNQQSNFIGFQLSPNISSAEAETLIKRRFSHPEHWELSTINGNQLWIFPKLEFE